MIEIERKFLVDMIKLNDEKPTMCPARITQGYLNQDPDRTVRVRLADHQAFITVKGKSSDNGMSRFEYETEIDRVAAEGLLQLCTGIVDKTRYKILHKGKLWEVDVFMGNNTGLVVAEIELKSEDEEFELPNWVTREVTGDSWYYNSNLGINPFCNW